MNPRPRASGLWACLAVLAATLSWPAAAAELDRARAAAERRDWATALPAYRSLAGSPDAGADLLIEAARVHGFADRHADAVALYRRALDLAPARRWDILPSLAWQALWAGDALAARELFVEWTAARPADEAAHDGLGRTLDDLRLHGQAADSHERAAARSANPAQARAARLRAARSLLWAGQAAQALQRYQALTEADPADRAAILGLASARDALGWHRAASAAMAAAGAPRDDGERLDLARSLWWSGHPELALPVLAPATGPEATWLRDHRLGRTQRPWLSGRAAHAVDRDRLEAWSLGLRGGVAPAADMALEAGARRLRLRDPAATAQGSELEAMLRMTRGGPTDPQGSWWTSLRVTAADIAGWQPLTGAAALAWVPDDRWRLDAELARERIDTPRALAGRVHVDLLSLGADFRPAPGWVLTGAVAALRFDDGNRRTRWLLRAEHRMLLDGWPWRPRLSLGADASGFDTTRPNGPQAADRGYWNPARYREARAWAALVAESRPWDVRLRLGLGHASETDGFGRRSRGRPQHWELSLGRDFAPGWRAELSAGGAGAGLGMAGGSGAGSGYWRRSVNLALTGWF